MASSTNLCLLVILRQIWFIPSFLATCRAASFTNTELNVVAGQPFVLTWTDAEGPVDIVLKFGDPKNLETVETLASNLSGDSTTVTLDADLPSGNYAFEIIDDSGENFSAQFPIEGNGGEKKSPSPTNTSQPSSTTTKEDKKETPKPESTDNKNTDTSTASENDSASADSSSTSNSGSGSKPSESSSTSDGKDAVGNSDGSGNSTGGGLSTGAKAGIGVGVGLAGLVALILAGLLVYRRGKAAGKAATKNLLPAGGEVAELGIEKKIPELGGQPRAEVMGDPRGHARELETGTEEEEKSLKRHELP